VTVGWRELHYDEFHNLFSLPNIRLIKSKRMRLEGHVPRVRELRNGYIILIGNPEGKKLFRRSKRRWDNKI
jgi:hypothetical protein